MPDPEPPEPAPPSRPRGVRRVLAVALGVALALATLEVAIRHIYWLPNDHDPVFGTIPHAGATVVYGLEGHGRSRWNEYGIRRASLPEPGSRPLLVVGDSFTEAFNVDDDLVYTQRLEALLAADGAAIPVLNAGHSGMSPADYVELAPRLRELFAPRWTIVELNAKDLAEDGFDPGRTHFERDAGGALHVVRVEVPLSRAHAFLDLVRSASSALVNYGIVRVKEFASATEPPLFRAGSSAPPPATAAPRPIADVLELLERSYDGRVTLVFLPDFDPRAPDQVNSEGERVFAAECASRGWSCTNLRDAFAEFAARWESPYGFPNSQWNSGHMNASGHAALARLLHAELTRSMKRDLL